MEENANIAKKKNKIVMEEKTNDIDNGGATLEEKTNELLSCLENSFRAATELRDHRRKNKLSDIGIANVSREINQLIKVTRRYVEN